MSSAAARQADYQRAYRARCRVGTRTALAEVTEADEEALRLARVLHAIEPSREDLAAAIKRLLELLPAEPR